MHGMRNLMPHRSDHSRRISRQRAHLTLHVLIGLIITYIDFSFEEIYANRLHVNIVSKLVKAKAENSKGLSFSLAKESALAQSVT